MARRIVHAVRRRLARALLASAMALLLLFMLLKPQAPRCFRHSAARE